MNCKDKKNRSLALFYILIGSGFFVLCVISSFFIALLVKNRKNYSEPSQQYLPTPNVIKAGIPQSDSFGTKINSLEVLEQTEIPINDPIELATRLGKVYEAPIFKSGLPAVYEIGSSKKFWKLDVDTNKYVETEAHLEYITPHLNFWIENGIDFVTSDLKELAETFENKIYPVNRSIFGSEWTPGVDNDERLTILYARGLGGVGGYFSSTDTLTQYIVPYSNEAEMFYLSADYTNLNDEFTFGVLAHEFQHMIHWNIDRNESAWVTEGLSELAVEINNFSTGGFMHMFAYNPDLQLNFWPGNEQGDSSPHYGASYLFMRYLYHMYGEDSIKELVSSQHNGLKSIDYVFEKFFDENNNNLVAETLFQDWSIKNFMIGGLSLKTDNSYGDMRVFPSFSPTELLSCEDSEWQDMIVNQFGTDYIQIDCAEDYQIEIIGNQTVKLLPVEPHSGGSYFWSNYGDESLMSLSQTFNFSRVDSPIVLYYWTWYDIEKDYDYLYLTATEDGKNFEILRTTTCTDKNPTGSNYGCGLNGKTNGWINESVDLSAYAGKNVTLTFEYITDMAVNGDGFVIDDISIDAINYHTDFEKDTGGWKAEGFVWIQNSLPQKFGIAMVKEQALNSVEKKISDEGLNYNKIIALNQMPIKPVFVISGLTRFTHQPATYKIRITKIT